MRMFFTLRSSLFTSFFSPFFPILVHSPMKRVSETEPILVSVFLPKGGVGKTALAYRLSLALAQRGKCVLVVDADGQENLTQLLVGTEVDRDYGGDYGKFFTERKAGSLYDGIECVRKEARLPSPLPEPLQVSDHLFLLPGNTALSEWGEYICAAEATMVSFPCNRNLTGAPAALVLAVAAAIKADYVILDLNPAMSSFNRCLWWASDFFICPCFSDYHSTEAFRRLARTLPEWIKTMESVLPLAQKASKTPLLKTDPPRFLGTLCGGARPPSAEIHSLTYALDDDGGVPFLLHAPTLESNVFDKVCCDHLLLAGEGERTSKRFQPSS
jgi:chromosome partitioning protein